jgi:polysaccharide pyruvyl transferase WcaK-like protein
VVIPFYPAVDLPVSRRLAAACGGTVIAVNLQPAEMMGFVGRMAVLVGVRLHALLFAAATGVPPVGLHYDPKVSSFFHDLGIGAPLPLDVDAGRMADAVTQAWDRRETLRSRLAAGVAGLRARAEVAAEVAARLYTEG